MQTKMDIVQRAKEYAHKAHEGQVRDDGVEPYIEHPRKVARLVAVSCPTDKNLIAAAWLHDTIEDTDTDYEDLLQEFGEDVANLVHEVTHEVNKVTGNTFPRLHSRRGITLKFADRLANLSTMESGGWNEKRQQHYLNKSKFWRA